MFATLEEKLIVAALCAVSILVGILGFIHHERSEGSAVCVSQQSKAATVEESQDAVDNTKAVEDFSGDLAAIPIAASHVPVLMCDAPSSVHQVATAASVEPAALPHSGNGASVSVGAKPVADIGPVVQDIALSCVLGATDAQELWNLAVKESMP